MMGSYGAGILIIAATVVLAMSGLFLVRTRVSYERLDALRENAGLFSSLTSVTYAIVVGFLVVMVWTNFQDTRTAVHAEANRLMDLERLSWGIGDGDGQRQRTAIAAYVRSIVDDEWPAMAAERRSMKTESNLDALWASYRTVEPLSQSQRAMYTQSLTALSDISDARHLRLQAADEKIAGVLWLLLIGGGVLMTAFSYLFATQDAFPHAVMTAALALLIGLNMFLIYALDHPFSSGPGVSPGPMHEALEHIRASRVAGERQADPQPRP